MLSRVWGFIKSLITSDGGKIQKPQAHWVISAITGVFTEASVQGKDHVTVTLGEIIYECKDLRQAKIFPRKGSVVSLVLCKPDGDGMRPLLWVYEGDAKSIQEEYNRRHWTAG